MEEHNVVCQEIIDIKKELLEIDEQITKICENAGNM